MPCGCNKRKQASKFAYVDEANVEHIYPTEVEAKAAQIRAGGGGKVLVKT
jgi:parvulin-like peptidyl-prolyl isomerase